MSWPNEKTKRQDSYNPQNIIQKNVRTSIKGPSEYVDIRSFCVKLAYEN